MADPYILVLAGFGVVALLTAWLPMLLRKLPLSLPILCVAIGIAVFSLPGTDPKPSPLDFPVLAERLTEMVVIIALMGAGLKLDRPLSFRGWGITWRLLGITMPLSILAIALLGWSVLGLSAASAVLLGAALAPTDPVLAADVQVGPPHSGNEDEARFALTSEAGLNDGLAFPFVHLALALAVLTHGPADGWLGRWLVLDLAWKLAAGVGIGWLVGKVLGYLTFRLPVRTRLARTGDGFVALAITCLSYGLTEMAHGYGFLAVFVTALALRNGARAHDYHEKLHDFAEQLERLLMMLILVLFGGAIAGDLLAPLGWGATVMALLVLLVVRPLAGMAGLIGSGRPADERWVISFFGIRGIGSFYYVAYALNHGRFDSPELLWALVGLIVLISVVLHGTTVTPIMRRLDAGRRSPQAREMSEAPSRHKLDPA